nr:enhancer of split mbeta protein [Drosophila suzukii]
MSSPKEHESHGPKTGAMSRTQQYRKVLKPLLERKRRARINRCVEDLKNLLMEVIHMDSEAMARMEKADILELTVHHLHRQRPSAATPTTTNTPSVCEPLNEQIATERYWSGFRQCVLEVSRFLQRNNCQLNSKFVEEMEQLVPFEQLFWRPW